MSVRNAGTRIIADDLSFEVLTYRIIDNHGGHAYLNEGDVDLLVNGRTRTGILRLSGSTEYRIQLPARRIANDRTGIIFDFAPGQDLHF